MTFGKVAKFGCLGLIGFFIFAAIIGFIIEALETPEQKAAEAAKRAAAIAKEKAGEQATNAANARAATDLLHKLTLLRRHLPQGRALHQIAPPARLGDIDYEPIDYAFLAQFAETGFAPIPANARVPWYRGQIMSDIEETVTTTGQPIEKRNAALAREAAELAAKPYYVVFVPLEEQLPKINADKKTFEEGYFDGWEIVVDSHNDEPLCEVKFEASSSAKVGHTRLTLDGIPLGSGIDSAIGKDFTDNFWNAANQARTIVAAGSPTASP